MIKELATIIKSKLWFGTVNKFRGYKARRELEAYMKTLSPKNQAWAKELRAKLDTASPDQAVGILRKEASALNEQHMRVTERIHAVESSVTDVTK